MKADGTYTESGTLKTVKVADIKDAESFNVIFYAGGHGTMWDFPDDKDLQKVAAAIYEAGGVVSAVCHGPSGLVNIKLSNGDHLVKGKKVTCFTNSEEDAVQKSEVMPFMLETVLKERGAEFSAADDWACNAVTSERVVTGQNPASSGAVAQAVIALLEAEAAEKVPAAEDDQKSDDNKRILLVVSGYSDMPATEAEKKEEKEPGKTGWYLPEVAHPYNEWVAKGYEITFVSPNGGEAPCDVSSIEAFKEDDGCNKFLEAMKADGTYTESGTLNTVKVADIKDAESFNVIFYAGGHGTMWDFPDDKDLQKVAAAIYEAGGVVSAVCHGPAGLVNIKLSNGDHLVKGKKVTCFTNSEEDAVKKSEVMPFMLETVLKERGAEFSGADDWAANAVTSERLVTGQNPASAGPVAKAVIELLEK